MDSLLFGHLLVKYPDEAHLFLIRLEILHDPCLPSIASLLPLHHHARSGALDFVMDAYTR